MRITAETVKKVIRDPKTEVVSFDVFDTLLLRPFWQPDDLFFFLDREAERLLGAPDAFGFSSSGRRRRRPPGPPQKMKGAKTFCSRKSMNIW